jgi:hypothetical protein
MKLIPSLVLLSMVTFCGSASSAAPKPPATAPAASAPAGLVEGAKNEQGLTAAIVVNKDSYVLNAAQSGKAFRDQIGGANNARGGGRLPAPPAVDLTFRITNTSEKPVTITIGGDESHMNLALAGQGAITVDNIVPMTMDYRMGNPTTIAPGKTYEMKIASLSFGTRGISKFAYWTEAGDYTITATLTYGLGEKQGTVTSGAAKVKVTKE